MPSPASGRSASTRLASPWTLGPCGASPAAVRSAPTHSASPWTLGTAGAISARSRQPTFPAPGQSDSLVPSARWGGPVLYGGTAPVASFSGRACFWAPALRFCHGCRRGPAQNRSTASSKARKSRIGPDVAARQRGVRSRVAMPQASRPEGLNPFPRTPNHGLRQDQPDRKPPNTQLTAQHRHNGSSEQHPVDNQTRCGQTTPTGAPQQDHPPQEPPIHSLPTHTDNPAAATNACGPLNALWTTAPSPPRQHPITNAH
ncbi:hypothetical protein LV75_001548 [Actinokineospora diospyrosa]|uniref:Uncharacterized protein n=1 Tax=Actinokineospora diospyrosa TaxID=103728 RepID=A0ABT1I8V0_9PSEU|nr:hypothetical protein [Actinokineospora diospyrosa]